MESRPAHELHELTRRSPGSSLIVSAGGRVGLSAVLGAVANGATTIVVIDIKPEKLAVALELGAMHVINGVDPDVKEQLAAILGAGADYAIDTSGNIKVVRTLVEATNFTGTVGLIGAAAPGAEFVLDYATPKPGRVIHRIVEGDSVPQDFIMRLIDLHVAGKFPFDKLVKLYPINQIQDAVEDSEHDGTLKAASSSEIVTSWRKTGMFRCTVPNCSSLR